MTQFASNVTLPVASRAYQYRLFDTIVDVHRVRDEDGGGPTLQRLGCTVTGPSLAGRLHSLGFSWWVSSCKSHATRRRGHLRVAISNAPDLSRIRSGRHAHAPGSSSVSCCCN